MLCSERHTRDDLLSAVHHSWILGIRATALGQTCALTARKVDEIQLRRDGLHHFGRIVFGDALVIDLINGVCTRRLRVQGVRTHAAVLVSELHAFVDVFEIKARPFGRIHHVPARMGIDTVLMGMEGAWRAHRGLSVGGAVCLRQ